MRPNSGFTLIELLVAMALLVILSGALYGTYFSVTAARERAGDRIAQRREFSSTLAMLHNELASSYFASPGTAVLQPEFIVEDRDSFGKPASLLQFTTIGPPRIDLKDTTPASDVVAVRYMVSEKEGALTLTRESKDLYLKKNPTPYPVVGDIEGFEVECYDGTKWVKSWDTKLNRMLPDKVRVTVTLKGGEKLATIATVGLAHRVLSLPMGAFSNGPLTSGALSGSGSSGSSLSGSAFSGSGTGQP